MRIELTEENRGSFWEDDRGARLQVVGWCEQFPERVIMRGSAGNVFSTKNSWPDTFRRLEGCDSFDWVEPKIERIPVTLWAHKAILEGMQPTIFASAVELKTSTKDFHVEIHSDNAGGWYVERQVT